MDNRKKIINCRQALYCIGKFKPALHISLIYTCIIDKLLYNTNLKEFHQECSGWSAVCDHVISWSYSLKQFKIAYSATETSLSLQISDLASKRIKCSI